MDPRAKRWLSTVASVVELKLKVSFARSELYTHALSEVSAALDEICQRAELSDPAARDVLGAFVPVLVDTDHLSRVWSLRATALASHHLALSRLLRCSTPEGHHIDETSINAQASVLQRADGRPMSLGERRALARRPTRAIIEKLVRDPHPMVTRILLQNPRITEDDVMRMAAHRPATKDITVEIARAWCHRPRVRQALVFNPGTPTAVSVPLLPLMIRPELADVRQAADLPAVVRATAGDLWELRPPMPSTPPPELTH